MSGAAEGSSFPLTPVAVNIIQRSASIWICGARFATVRRTGTGISLGGRPLDKQQKQIT